MKRAKKETADKTVSDVAIATCVAALTQTPQAGRVFLTKPRLNCVAEASSS